MDRTAYADAHLYQQLQSGLAAAAADIQTSPLALARGLSAGYRGRPHVRVISDAFVRLDTRESDRLLIMCPPQVGKSVAAGVWGPLWWLIKHPAHRVIVASYGADLAHKRGRAVRDLAIAHGHEFGLRHGGGTVQDWQLASGGGMRSVGVGGGLTGHSADVGICDDPHKDRAEAESPRIRESVWDWWTSTFLSRLAPGAPAILILTRWHDDDLAGRVLAEEGRRDEGGRWEVVHMPALADPRFGADPLGRKAGEPLTHPKIRSRDRAALLAHWEEKRRTAGARDWAALYQGDPRPVAGALVTRQLLRSIRHFGPERPEPQKVAVAVDPSGGGRDAAGIVGGYLGADGRLWITHDLSGVMASAVWSRQVCWLAAETNASLVLVETNFGGDLATLAVRTAWDALKNAWPTLPDSEKPEWANTRDDNPFDALPPRVKAVRAKVGKLLRAEPIAQQMIEDRVRLAAALPELEEEWATWQPTDPLSPGRIDASVYLAYGLLPVPGAQSRVSSPADVRRQQVDDGLGAASRIDRGRR
ncbi:terminase large subunit domain-containing protein [Nonomuraea polychroma]|uniref:terminase large subunit domain-containing protein n=1 Tax=Nonomuraea polychroma TaxID=46176 RepID=UPI003D92039B